MNPNNTADWRRLWFSIVQLLGVIGFLFGNVHDLPPIFLLMFFLLPGGWLAAAFIPTFGPNPSFNHPAVLVGGLAITVATNAFVWWLLFLAYDKLSAMNSGEDDMP